LSAFLSLVNFKERRILVRIAYDISNRSRIARNIW